MPSNRSKSEQILKTSENRSFKVIMSQFECSACLGRDQSSCDGFGAHYGWVTLFEPRRSVFLMFGFNKSMFVS
jgi:hypothetical protein